MKFEMLDKKMRAFEENLDQYVLPGLFIVVRLDGRNFTRLTKELLALDTPFDDRFKNAMIATVYHLMNCGFNITYGYTESDEISLLLNKNENAFARKTRKLISILAGEASAKFTQSVGIMGVFDCRVIPLPTEDLVVDYFRWRTEDANRNAMNAWCYWTMRKNGRTASEATKALEGKSVQLKNQLLFEYGINYNDLPAWQKRGIGFRYIASEVKTRNPEKNTALATPRKKLHVDMNLPLNIELDIMLRHLITDTTNA